MKLSIEGLDLIKSHEGCRLNAYICPAGVATIGYGNTFYNDGTRVNIGDKISQAQANDLFLNIVNAFSIKVSIMFNPNLSDNQFSALVSFAYNVGTGALGRSTLRKKVLANHKDVSIRDEFMKWTKSGGKELNGLVARRKDEANLYFTA
jgi:lysozyme